MFFTPNVRQYGQWSLSRATEPSQRVRGFGGSQTDSRIRHTKSHVLLFLKRFDVLGRALALQP